MRLILYTFAGAIVGAMIALLMDFTMKQLAATAFFFSLATYAFYREFSSRNEDEEDVVRED